MKNYTKNYFELLELPEVPRLDAAHIRKQYFALQRRFHPDNALSAAMRLEMLQISADINAAYNALKDDELRLYYLLKLRRFDILAENAQGQGVAVPQYVLLQAMELREEAMEAEAQQFATKIQAIKADLLEKAIAAFEQQDWQQAANFAINLRYIPR